MQTISNLINKYKNNYPNLNSYDLRKINRAVCFIQNNGKVYTDSIQNFVDANNYYDDRANNRFNLAYDVLEEMNLLKN